MRPVSSGDTQITIVVAGQTKTVPVTVKLPPTEPPYSFRHEVTAVFSRAGCNMGACHGYSLGKNGFRLSLRGQSPEQDYVSISREFGSRRVNFETPEASLLVASRAATYPMRAGALRPAACPVTSW